MYGHVQPDGRRPGSGLGALRCRHTLGRVISAGEKRGKEALTDKRPDRGRGIGIDGDREGE
jgi:hypothetical protein